MKAWQLHGPADAGSQPLRLAEVPEPEPGPGEIRLRVRACGVCLTDVHTVEGDLVPPSYPVIPGHQVVGVVDAVGPGVAGVRVGERRGAFWLHRACGRCPACRRGEENLCPHAAFTGLHVPGGYAEAMVVPAASTVPIPQAFTDAEAAPLLCAGVIGYRALRLSGLQPGERLALFGFGSSAHLVIQVARHRGCEVVVFTRSPGHRRLALELGAAWAGSAEVLAADEPAAGKARPTGTAGDGWPPAGPEGGAGASGVVPRAAGTAPTSAGEARTAAGKTGTARVKSAGPGGAGGGIDTGKPLSLEGSDPAAGGRPPLCDRAIVFAPAGELVPLALRAVRPGGTVVINAVHMTDIPSFPYRLIHGERVVRTVAHVTRRDAREFMEVAAAIPLRVAVRPYGFDQANQALYDVKHSRVDGSAVLAMPSAQA
ncbi:Alcohol dehydrogenase GroES domain protein [Thermaerobacter marianensis DSM 12885]|uniref:alcohol dehydrogenase n=1 Tax=Thermaerobacter marianensis (strain ATCC 700841 / DSM 12885 / JCM 10246 / 7p75a) TaxID=644966 RepID=E6SJX4_THEM7|nr:arabinose dehydrogenase [Thermaerobacter marianensis]ADU52207.1 Alcohol dehydrogenase GroES domain protein [Thermaerobacter marianensis DSM 12885]